MAASASIGTSYDGFTALMTLVNPHPALKASVPINPMVDVWKGDDWFHNGAFRQEMISYVYGQTANKKSEEEWFTGAYDDYATYLRYGSAGAYADAMGMEQLPFWQRLSQHPAYDEYWQDQAVDRILGATPLTVPTLLVDSEWDQEDIYGAPAVFNAVKASDNGNAHLVLGRPGAVERDVRCAIRRRPARLDPSRIGAEQQREVVTADGVRTTGVQRAGKLELDELEDRLGQLVDLHRGADLVDEEARPLRCEPLLRPVLEASVDQGRANDRRAGVQLGDAPFRFRLRPAVLADRGRRIVLSVPAAKPVEDEVAREVHEPAAASCIGRGGRAVDVRRPGIRPVLQVGGVHHGVDSGCGSGERRGVSDVEPVPAAGEPLRGSLPPRRGHVHPVRSSAPDELGAEVPAAAGDEEPRYQPRRSSSSPGSSEAVEIPTIASPSPAETSASTRGSR